METLKSSTDPPTASHRKRSSPKDIQVAEQRVRENGKEIYLAALDREYIIFCQIYSNAPLCLEAMYVNISIYISWDCSYLFQEVPSSCYKLDKNRLKPWSTFLKQCSNTVRAYTSFTKSELYLICNRNVIFILYTFTLSYLMKR